jgi:hypothetical protein
MVDPIASKVAVKPSEIAGEKGNAGAAKTGESKFDKVRAQLQDDSSRGVQIPPEITKVSPEQRNALQADLTKRLQGTKTHSPQAIFKPEMKRAKEGLQHLTKRVNELPKTAAFDPLRQRLASIDSQYQATGQLLNSTSHASPEELLKLQMQMYQMSENLEVMSKVVEQVTTGMKSILQTQL